MRVAEFLHLFSCELLKRATLHDRSKLEEPEAPIFEEFTPQLKGTTYGSAAYQTLLANIKPALDHHYANNRHHPEYHSNGIQGMTLIDLIEVLADWKSASERHADGDVYKSVEINQKRFGYSDDLKQIFINTLKEVDDHV
jgi:hypothetical protein